MRWKKIKDKKKRIWINPVRYLKEMWITYSSKDEYYYKEILDKKRNLLKIKFKRRKKK